MLNIHFPLFPQILIHLCSPQAHEDVNLTLFIIADKRRFVNRPKCSKL